MISLPEPSPKHERSWTAQDLAQLEVNEAILSDPAGTVMRAREGLLDFTRFTFRRFLLNWHHRLICRKLDDLIAGRNKRLIINMPPRHTKSELATRRLSAYVLGRDPTEHIMACSYADDLASRMNRDVQRIIDSDSYRVLFPATRLSSSYVSKGSLGRYVRTTNLFETVQFAGSFRSAGVGGGIAGMGYTLGIIDDPIKNREEADSPTIRQRVWEWWTNDFFPRRQPGARIIITMTRWHRDDLVGRILKMAQEHDSEAWETLVLPGLRGDFPTDLDDPREAGEPLWPWFMSSAEHERTRRLDRNAYAALYDQNPGDAGGSEWPASYFGDWIWVEPDRWPREFDLRIVTLDPSKGKSDKHGDYSAIVFLGIKHGLLYVDADLDRRPPHQICRAMVDMCVRYRPHFVGIEANQFQELLVDEFERQCGRRFTETIGCHATPMVNSIKKEVRIRRLGHYLANRELRFKKDCPSCHLLVDQLMDFPNGEHDDGPDALEMAERLPGDIGVPA